MVVMVEVVEIVPVSDVHENRENMTCDRLNMAVIVKEQLSQASRYLI